MWEGRNKEGFLLALSLRVQSVVSGKSWWQEHEKADHMAPTQGMENEMDTSFCLGQDPSPGRA